MTKVYAFFWPSKCLSFENSIITKEGLYLGIYKENSPVFARYENEKPIVISRNKFMRLAKLTPEDLLFLTLKFGPEFNFTGNPT